MTELTREYLTTRRQQIILGIQQLQAQIQQLAGAVELTDELITRMDEKPTPPLEVAKVPVPEEAEDNVIPFPIKAKE